MIHGLTFKEYVEEEKTKLSEMNKAEKIDYFKEYYLKLCIFAVVVLILLLWLVVDIGLNLRHNVVTGGVVNTKLNDEGAEFLGKKYLEHLKLSRVFNQVGVAPDIFLDDDDPQSYTIFQAELAVNSYNYLITDNKGLDYVVETECLADLDTVLDSEMSGQLSDKKIYRKLKESGTEIAAAIDITDTAFAKEYIEPGGKVYFVISGKEEKYDSAVNMLKYILEK